MNSAGASQDRTLGCIGKCTTGLTHEELDRITDHVQWTLASAQGRKIFNRYLTQGRRRTDLACLELYEQCTEYVDNERVLRGRENGTNIEPLISDVNAVLSALEELDDVPELDLALLEQYSEALDSRDRDALMAVLEHTKTMLMNHLRQAHKGFRTYAKQPCPNS